MKEVLEDTRLVSLQREGGAVLARMRREDLRFPQSEDFRYHLATGSIRPYSFNKQQMNNKEAEIRTVG